MCLRLNLNKKGRHESKGLGQPKALGHHRQKGIGLPATIFLLVVVALIVVAMADLNEASSLGFGQDVQSTRAFYAAESGAQIALNRVFVGTDTCTMDASNPTQLTAINFGTDAGLANCRAEMSCFRVDVASTGAQYYTFTSLGTCGSGFTQASREVQVRAQSN